MRERYDAWVIDPNGIVHHLIHTSTYRTCCGDYALFSVGPNYWTYRGLPDHERDTITCLHCLGSLR